MPGNSVDVNGLSTYYRAYGQGDPLVLLHGGFGSGEDLEPVVRELAKHFRVIAPDRRGHGRTADVEGPITYDNMGSDTIAFMEAIQLPKAHLVGFSDGGILCLLIALQRPDLVSLMVPVSANFHHEGVAPQTKAMFGSVTPEVLKMMIPE